MAKNTRISGTLYLLFCVATAIIGNTKNHSLGWAILDGIFAPLAWVKWLICQEINLTIINHAFSFFLK